MPWDLRLEPLNVDRTEWLVTAIERDDKGELQGETSQRLRGGRDDAITAGKRMAQSVVEIRTAREQAEVLTAVDIAALPPAKVTGSDVERARVALRRTRALRAATLADVQRLVQELADARARDDAAQASVVADQAALTKLEADLAAGL